MYLVQPVDVLGLAGKVIKLTSGPDHVCALLQTGAVQCWGLNQSGALGNSSAPGSTYVPTFVIGLNGPAVNISAGNSFTCALLASGQIQCWGRNSSGQLGNTTALGGSTATPVFVQGLSGVPIAITTGSSHACALLATGIAQCWGDNRYGELGNNTNSGTNAANPSPLTVQSITNLTQISAQITSTCALNASGGVTCWGQNFAGELGNPTNSGTGNANPIPLDVTGITSGALRIFHLSSGENACAIVQ